MSGMRVGSSTTRLRAATSVGVFDGEGPSLSDIAQIVQHRDSAASVTTAESTALPVQVSSEAVRMSLPLPPPASVQSWPALAIAAPLPSQQPQQPAASAGAAALAGLVSVR